MESLINCCYCGRELQTSAGKSKHEALCLLAPSKKYVCDFILSIAKDGIMPSCKEYDALRESSMPSSNNIATTVGWNRLARRLKLLFCPPGKTRANVDGMPLSAHQVLDFLKTNGPATSKTIIEQAGMSLYTVKNGTSELLEMGLVDFDSEQSTGQGRKAFIWKALDVAKCECGRTAMHKVILPYGDANGDFNAVIHKGVYYLCQHCYDWEFER